MCYAIYCVPKDHNNEVVKTIGKFKTLEDAKKFMKVKETKNWYYAIIKTFCKEDHK